MSQQDKQQNERNYAGMMVKVYNWLREYQKRPNGNWLVFNVGSCQGFLDHYLFRGHGQLKKIGNPNREFSVDVMMSGYYRGLSIKFEVDKKYSCFKKMAFSVGWGTQEQDGRSKPDEAIIELGKKFETNGKKFNFEQKKQCHDSKPIKKFKDSPEDEEVKGALYDFLDKNAESFKSIPDEFKLDTLETNNAIEQRIVALKQLGLVEVDQKGGLFVPDSADYVANMKGDVETDGDGAAEETDENKGDEMSKEIRKLLESSHQVILTGAPGTGKTYLAKKVAMAMLGKDYTQENWAEAFKAGRVGFCQFHPSYDYSDFVEGLRPVTVGNGENAQVGFKRMDGVFKAFCKKALNGGARNWNDDFENAWKLLVSRIDEGPEFGLEIPLISGRGSFALTLNVSGSGLASQKYKDKVGDKDWISGTVKFFSREQLYNVFLGLSGVPSGGHDSYRKAIVDYMKKECGLVEYVKDNTDKQSDAASPYVFIIDEINRGDISKIFGELFFSIDPGYRGKKGLVKTQYQNLVEPRDEFENGFYVPTNVYIIGTMNDIDRSVESMDFAIRRRFVWKEVPADPEVLDSNDARKEIPDDRVREKATSLMKALNNEVVEELGSEYAIGPAYFFKLPKLQNDFSKLWDMNLKPLLREYLRGNSKDEITAKMKKFEDAYFESLPETQKRDDKLNAPDQNGKDASGVIVG